MFYRQKVLLALIEEFGGQLASTDLQKMLFLFCQLTNQNHYDFFPYTYGAFSFTSYYDKRKLIERGLLKDSGNFELNKPGSYIGQIETTDRIKLRAFISKFRQIGGQELIRKTYLEYPAYVARSEIADTILTKQEYNTVSSFWNTSTETVLFTIGYEAITIDQYLYKLIANNVNTLVDVRKNPFSRKHGFTQKEMKDYVEKAGIRYFHLPELGISSHLRKDLTSVDSYKLLFEHYTKEILPLQQQALATLKEWIVQFNRVAITCFEADPLMCHRHKIAELLEHDESLGVLVRHI